MFYELNRYGENGMHRKIKSATRMLTLAVITGVFVVLSGCASTTTTDSLQSQIDAMKSDVAAARADAASANATANEALNAANAANARAMETDTKIDRMFRKTMQK